MRIRKPVRIHDGNNMPVNILCKVNDLRILRGQEFIDEPRGRGGGDPLARVNVRLDENGAISLENSIFF